MNQLGNPLYPTPLQMAEKLAQPTLEFLLVNGFSCHKIVTELGTDPTTSEPPSGETYEQNPT